MRLRQNEKRNIFGYKLQYYYHRPLRRTLVQHEFYSAY